MRRIIKKKCKYNVEQLLHFLVFHIPMIETVFQENNKKSQIYLHTDKYQTDEWTNKVISVLKSTC